MNAKPSRVESEPDAINEGGADLDATLAKLLGTVIDVDNPAVDEQPTNGSSAITHDVVAERARTSVESVDSAPKTKSTRRSRAAAQLEDRVDDAVRSIVNHHEFKTTAPLYRSIAVVSGLPGEGVTTIAQGLARVIARDFDTTVCIVDTHTDGGGHGIYDVATGHAELDDVLVDEGDGIFRLALGEVPPGALNSLFRLPGWITLLNRLTAEFGHCVFDTAPILGRSNTLTILRHVEAHVLVTRYGATSAAQVKAIAHELRSQPRLGSVLNGYQTKTPAFIRRFFSE